MKRCNYLRDNTVSQLRSPIAKGCLYLVSKQTLPSYINVTFVTNDFIFYLITPSSDHTLQEESIFRVCHLLSTV
jgi:hypothetical protein